MPALPEPVRPHTAHPVSRAAHATDPVPVAGRGPTVGPRPDAPTDDPAPTDEPVPGDVHVMILGLGPLGAALALSLLECGVQALNVIDPAAASEADLRTGHYGTEADTRSREMLVRRQLRRRSPVCVPLSAPELFPPAGVAPAMVVRVLEPADLAAPDTTVCRMSGPGRADDGAGPDTPGPAATYRASPDPGLPALTVLSDGPVSLVGPVTRWQDQPCLECLAAAIHACREDHRHAHPDGAHPGAARTGYPVTRALTVLDVTATVLAETLRQPGSAQADGTGRPFVVAHGRNVTGLDDDGHEPPLPGHGHTSVRTALTRYGLLTAETDLDTGCLCGWGV